MFVFVVIGIIGIILYSVLGPSPLPESIDKVSTEGQANSDIPPGYKQTDEGSVIPATEDGGSNPAQIDQAPVSVSSGSFNPVPREVVEY